MPERSRKRPSDVNELAKQLVEEATGAEPKYDPYEGKDPAAVELGRRGGLKGGKARAAKMTPKQRSEAARKAAAIRWAKLERRVGNVSLAARSLTIEGQPDEESDYIVDAYLSDSHLSKRIRLSKPGSAAAALDLAARDPWVVAHSGL